MPDLSVSKIGVLICRMFFFLFTNATLSTKASKLVSYRIVEISALAIAVIRTWVATMRALLRPFRFPSLLGHLELIHSKSRRNRTSHEGPVAQAYSVLPLAALDDDLGTLALQDVLAEHGVTHGGAVVPRQREPERGAGVVVPDLDRAEHAMPMRQARLALQQVVDARAVGATVGGGLRVAEGLDYTNGKLGGFVISTGYQDISCSLDSSMRLESYLLKYPFSGWGLRFSAAMTSLAEGEEVAMLMNYIYG